MNLVPKLRKEKKVINIHQDELIDEYAWIKQKDWQSVLKDPSKLNKEVLKYINEENNYKSEKWKIFKMAWTVDAPTHQHDDALTC